MRKRSLGKRTKERKRPTPRFTVTVSDAEYDGLRKIQDQSDDWIPLTLVVSLAISEFLDRKKGSQGLKLRLDKYRKKKYENFPNGRN